ncbi:MAG: LysM peptidoglycan-binding domain-containing protein [Flavobacteriaceae bacterium]|nr:LysM peptidoglycan-binding domain-containing protein [Flavobacteriaceae bacterium]
MKHFKFLVIVFILSIAVSCGQQKKYIVYKVKQGETMRSIAKKLQMKTKDLLRLNPDVRRRPEPDTEIFIPRKNSENLVVSSDNTSKNNSIKSTDVKKDTIISVEEIDTITDDYVLHKVSKGDTFYSITRYYNVLESELLMLNPELSEGLKLGATIKIKKRVDGEEIDLIYKDTIADDTPLKIALLLPFRAETLDTVDVRDVFKDGDRNLANIVTDFYLGAELAVDSLRNQGLQIELSVFDTEKRNTKIHEIIESKVLEDKDAIIGSIYSDETKKLASVVSAPLIFPVFSKAQTSFSSSKIVKTAPDKHLYKEKLLSHITKRYTNQNIIVVGDSTTASITQIKQIANILKQHDSIDVVHEIIPHYGYIAQERFLKMMQPDTTKVENWVIIATTNDVVAADAINSLISFPDPEEPEEGEEPEEKINYTVKLFGFEKSDYVNNNKLAQLGFVYVTDTYIDESSVMAKNFNKQYLKKNKALPSYYATRGFDVTYDILMRLASGKKLSRTFSDGISYRVESKFDYNKRIFGISENRGLYLLEFQPDLSIIRVE